MVNKIIDAICIALSNEFGAEYKIYTDNVEQGFSNPCFYVSSINSSRNHFISKKYKSKNSFEVLYFPSDTDDKSFEISKVTLWPFFIKISEISTNTISPRKSHFYHYIQ